MNLAERARVPACGPMYAINLHRPWATLVALGIKNVETRSWPAPARLIGQTIAIHAGNRAFPSSRSCRPD